MSNAFYSTHCHTVKSTLCLPALLGCNWEVGAQDSRHHPTFSRPPFQHQKKSWAPSSCSCTFTICRRRKYVTKAFLNSVVLPRWSILLTIRHSRETSPVCSTGETCYMFVCSDPLAEMVSRGPLISRLIPGLDSVSHKAPPPPRHLG